jgi:hypothetical protein
MQHLLFALLVATVATSILTVSRPETEPMTAPQHVVPAPVQAAATVQTAPLYATVVKPFGASVRAAPSLEAGGLYNAACGASLQAAAVESGWVKVQTEAGFGWIGTGRVTLGSEPARIDCSGKRFLYSGGEVWAFVPTDCLGLRSRPSGEATALACVANGHLFTVVDGPFDPGDGDDWFKVSSPTTGTGWVQGGQLFPL